jgi:hypothetical protein
VVLNFALSLTCQTNQNDTAMTTEKKIISRRELAISLYDEGPVRIELISKKLERTVKMWQAKKEVIIENGFLKLA